MANEDKDRNVSTPGASTAGRTPGATDPRLSTSQQASPGSMSGMPGSTVSSVQSGTPSQGSQRMIDEARQSAKDMANQAKEQGKSMLERQKDTAAQQVDTAAHALRTTGAQLQDEGQTQVGRYVQKFAGQLESFSEQLRHKNLDTLIRDAENLGRRSPATLFAGSLLAGFALARFLKSSAEHQQYEGRARTSRGYSPAQDDTAEYSEQPYGADRDSGDLSAAYGSATASGRGTNGIDSGRTGLSGSAIEGSAITGNSPSAVGSGSTANTAGTSSPSISNPKQPGGGNYGNR